MNITLPPRAAAKSAATSVVRHAAASPPAEKAALAAGANLRDALAGLGVWADSARPFVGFSGVLTVGNAVDGGFDGIASQMRDSLEQMSAALEQQLAAVAEALNAYDAAAGGGEE